MEYNNCIDYFLKGVCPLTLSGAKGVSILQGKIYCTKVVLFFSSFYYIIFGRDGLDIKLPV